MPRIRTRRWIMAGVVATVLAAGAAVATFTATGAGAATITPAAAPALIGTGWKQYSPPKFIQLETHGKYTPYPYSKAHVSEAGVSYDRSAGVETFKLFNNDASNRGEIRIQSTYTKGMQQFEGDLRVAAPTNDECVVQIWGAKTTASVMMIRAFSANGGTLKAMHTGTVIATHIYNTWVHINIVHDATANTVAVYVNGKLATKWNVEGGTHYWKYGIYGTLTTATAQSQWRGVGFYSK